MDVKLNIINNNLNKRAVFLLGSWRSAFIPRLVGDQRFNTILPLAIFKKLETYEVILPEEMKLIEDLMYPYHKQRKCDGN